MIGATAKADQFATRSGNESTKASRTGRNLLGWGEAETLTIPQQRDAARAALQQAHGRLVEIKQALELDRENAALRETRREQVERVAKISSELAALNEAMKSVGTKHDIGDYLIDMFRRSVTKTKWEIICKEARSQFDADRALHMAELERCRQRQGGAE